VLDNRIIIILLRTCWIIGLLFFMTSHYQL